MSKLDTIIDKALEIAKTKGLINLELSTLAEALDMQKSNIRYHTGMTWTEFHDMIGKMAPESKAKIFKVDKKRASIEQRKEQMIEGMMELCENNPNLAYKQITTGMLADYLSVSRSLINAYFSKRELLDKAVMREAVKQNRHLIIAYGIIDQHPVAMAADEEIKREALAAYSASLS